MGKTNGYQTGYQAIETGFNKRSNGSLVFLTGSVEVQMAQEKILNGLPITIRTAHKTF